MQSVVQSAQFNPAAREQLLSSSVYLQPSKSVAIAGQDNDYYAMLGGKDAYGSTSRGALAARGRPKDGSLLYYLLSSDMDDMIGDPNAGRRPRPRRMRPDADRIRRLEEERIRAEEERIRAEEERLRTEEERIRAEEQRLNAEEERIRAMEADPNADPERIRAAREQLESDRVRLAGDRERYSADQERLAADRGQLEADRRNPPRNNRELQERQTRLQEAQERLERDNARLAEDQERLRVDQERLNNPDAAPAPNGRAIDPAAADADPARTNAADAPGAETSRPPQGDFDGPNTVRPVRIIGADAPHMATFADSPIVSVRPGLAPIPAQGLDTAPRINTEIPDQPRFVAPDVMTEAPNTSRPVQVDDALPSLDTQPDRMVTPETPAAPDMPRAIDATPSVEIDPPRFVAPEVVTEGPNAPRPIQADDALPNIGGIQADASPSTDFRAGTLAIPAAGEHAPTIDARTYTPEARLGAEFEAFRAQNGAASEAFNRVADPELAAEARAAANAEAVTAANAERVNTNAGMRAGRYIEAIMPGKTEAVLIGAIGAVWGAEAAAHATPVLDVYMARRQGREDEARIRVYENAFDFGLPLAGAGVGAVAGGTGGLGIGAIPGAIIGFLGGIALSLGFSEAVRAIARAHGQDVDRGLITELFADDLAVDMENHFREMGMSEDIAAIFNIEEGETLADAIERALDGAETEAESLALYNNIMIEFSGVIATEMERIQEDLGSAIEEDTGLEDGSLAIANPETRAHLIEFYGMQVAQGDPAERERSQQILDELARYERLEEQFVQTEAARISAEIAHAQSYSNQTFEDFLGFQSGTIQEFERRELDERVGGLEISAGFVGMRAELESIEFFERAGEIEAALMAYNGDSTEDIFMRVLTNGTSVYQEMGVVEPVAAMHGLQIEAIETLQASQAAFVEENYELLSLYVQPDAFIDTWGWNNSTLLEELDDEIDGSSRPEDIELRRLLEETNNLRNVTPDQMVRLMQNRTFYDEFVKAAREDEELTEILENYGFRDRNFMIERLRGANLGLERSATEYGFEYRQADPNALARRQNTVRPDQELTNG